MCLMFQEVMHKNKSHVIDAQNMRKLILLPQIKNFTLTLIYTHTHIQTQTHIGTYTENIWKCLDMRVVVKLR